MCSDYEHLAVLQEYRVLLGCKNTEFCWASRIYLVEGGRLSLHHHNNNEASSTSTVILLL